MASRRRPSSTCTSAGRVTAKVLLSFLAISSSPASTVKADQRGQVVLPDTPILAPLIPEPPAPAEHTFTLRHVLHHGTYKHPTLHRKRDVGHADAEVWLEAEDGHPRQKLPPLKARSQPRKIERLVDRRPAVVDPMVAMARQRGYALAGLPSAWTIDDVPGPNITDKETVLSMALVAADAYVEKPGLPDWEEVGTPFNNSADFGWESDGLRGHIWSDETNTTIIIGLKGTSPAVFDGEGTTTNDKLNDNLFFSCCCAQQGSWSWHQVCDCATGTYSCNNTCVTRALREENRYYQAALELYSNVTAIYGDVNYWVVGHSLGGAVSSLLGLTYGLPVVTFEAVPEALAAGRLGLPVPPNADPAFPQTRELTGSFHVGHTADPIYIGTCNGATASCSFAGYAMESACHTGYECAYDTVGDKGWRVGIGTHKIRAVINDVIMKYDTAPDCKFTPECRDCANWKMYESNSTSSTTTAKLSTTSKTLTRTATCLTPGWWGCLDESTTQTATTTTSTASTTSTSTSTCKTPGWFGCKDEITTTTTTSITTTTTPTITTTSELSTPTCQTPGWFTCKDRTTATVSTHAMTSPPRMPTVTSGGPQPTEPAKGNGRCIRRNWLGFCKEREGRILSWLGYEEI